MKKSNKKNIKVAVVVSRFNQKITGKMLNGAIATLKKGGVIEENIKVIWVPGAYEIPLACQRLVETKKYDALVALGAVIKGETDHYYYVAGEASKGVMRVMLEHSIPIGFGIIMVRNLNHAIARSSGKSNKGAEAAEAALEMIGKFE